MEKFYLKNCLNDFKSTDQFSEVRWVVKITGVNLVLPIVVSK